METEKTAPELYTKYRPKKFKEVIGQDRAVDELLDMVDSKKVKHAILFTGPSGTGKTTLARILATKLECSKHDLTEVNAADFRGIDTVRDIRTRMLLAPIQGKVRVYIIDEAHQLTKDAQSSLLKMLEEPPSHVYFMLATTDPAKLLKTIHTRCTEIKLDAVGPGALKQLVQFVSGEEKIKVGVEALDAIVEFCEGSPRKALVFLASLAGVPEAEQAEKVRKSAGQRAAIELCRLLLANKKGSWKQIAAVIKECDDEPESIRQLILAWMGAVLLNSGNPRAFDCIEAFSEPLYTSGKAGLTANCFHLMK